ncbi:MAG: immunity 22 family protein, partial [Chloroflexia bacterium]
HLRLLQPRRRRLHLGRFLPLRLSLSALHRPGLRRRRQRNNRFATDSDLIWFDHDFQEASFHQEVLRERRITLQGTSYLNSFIDKAERLLQQVVTASDNAIFLLYNYTCSNQMSEVAERDDCKLIYVGTFQYTE